MTANAKTWVWHNLLLQLMEALKSLKMYFIGITTAMAGLEIIAACITVVNPLFLLLTLIACTVTLFSSRTVLFGRESLCAAHTYVVGTYAPPPLGQSICINF